MTELLPKSWKEVSLIKGKQLFSLPSTGLTDSEYITSVYAILTGEDLEKLDLVTATEVKSQIADLLGSQTDAMKYSFNINGEEYYVEYDLTRVSFGQFIDIERIIEQSEGNIWNNIEQLISCLVRKKKIEEIKRKTKFNFWKKKDQVEVMNYELEDYDFGSMLNRSKLFEKNMSVDDVQSVLLFFSLIGINYINQISTTYSMENQLTVQK